MSTYFKFSLCVCAVHFFPLELHATPWLLRCRPQQGGLSRGAATHNLSLHRQRLQPRCLGMQPQPPHPACSLLMPLSSQRSRRRGRVKRSPRWQLREDSPVLALAPAQRWWQMALDARRVELPLVGFNCELLGASRLPVPRTVFNIQSLQPEHRHAPEVISG